jgi:hypothetical protein
MRQSKPRPAAMPVSLRAESGHRTRAQQHSMKNPNEQQIANAVRHWLESLVIDLNLCPFAKRELVKDRVRFVVTPACTEDELLQALQAELELLQDNTEVETTLLIHPAVLQDFGAYNQFLNGADDLLAGLQLEGVFQVASFHPDYRFADAAPNDAENYTNRSPYPLLHILREASLEQVIADTLDVEQIPVRNIALMNGLGREELQKMLQACVTHKDK